MTDNPQWRRQAAIRVENAIGGSIKGNVIIGQRNGDGIFGRNLIGTEIDENEISFAASATIPKDLLATLQAAILEQIKSDSTNIENLDLPKAIEKSRMKEWLIENGTDAATAISTAMMAATEIATFLLHHGSS